MFWIFFSLAVLIIAVEVAWSKRRQNRAIDTMRDLNYANDRRLPL